MTEKDLIICGFVILIYSSVFFAWQIASIRDELGQVIKHLKEHTEDGGKEKQ